VPELPEVETVVRELRPLLVGRRLLQVQRGELALRRQWLPEWTAALQGRRVREIRRRGKWIQLILDQQLILVVHLGMTGQLQVMPANAPVQPHTHLVVALSGAPDQLRYCDIRRFGSATLFTSEEEVTRFFQNAGLGPEPFDLDAKYLHSRLQATERNLKALLLDQRLVAGVGNIYADEALFEAKLPPTKRGKEVTVAEARRLRDAIVRVLTRAIEQRGSSIRNYVGGSGLKGSFQKEFSVYGCTGKQCRRCRTLIVRVRLAGRSTHYCPKCQKA